MQRKNSISETLLTSANRSGAFIAPRRAVLLLFFCAVIVYSGSIWHRPLLAPDEISNALTACGMFRDGSSAAYSLLTALSIKTAGENAFAVRLPSVLYTLLTGTVIFLLALRIRNRKTAFAGALIYWSSALVFAAGTFAGPSPRSAFFTAAAAAGAFLCCSENGIRNSLIYLPVTLFFTAAGALLCGPLAPVLVFAAAAMFVIIRKKWSKAVVPAAILLSSAAVYAVVPHLFKSGAAVFSANGYLKTLVIYLPVLICGLFPWLLLAPAGVMAFRKKRHEFLNDDLFLFSIIAVVLWFILLPLLKTDTVFNITVSYPFAAVILAMLAAELPETGSVSLAGKTLQWFCAAAGCLFVVFTVWHLLPAIPGKYKLYTRVELLPAILGAGVMLLWFNMAAKEKDCFPERKFIWFCIGCAVIMLTVNHVIPFKIIREMDHTAFIRRAVLPHLSPDAAVTADSILSPAASWVFKRTIPEVPAADKLPEILAKSKKSHRQFVILTGSPEQTVKLPPRKTIVRSGRLTAVIYGDD